MRHLMFALGVVGALALAGLAPPASAQTTYNPPGYGYGNPAGTGVTSYNPPGYGYGNPPGAGYAVGGGGYGGYGGGYAVGFQATPWGGAYGVRYW